MEIHKKYIETVNNIKILTSTILNTYDNELIENKSTNLINTLKENSFVKIPFVGDFSAGKSTLLNYLINNKDLLPTSINPTTAVSYELYFDTNERLEVYENNILIETKSLDQIENLNTKPGYIIRVYINNEIIKKYNDKNMVLVDMPGIDSGYEEHQNAIFNYISKGTAFVIVNDIESGTLKRSTINFIKEIEKYNFKTTLLLSKADKKSTDEAIKIKDHIIEISKTTFNTNVNVELVSAVNSQISPLENFLNSIDAKILFEIQNKPLVLEFMDEVIQKLEIQKNVLTSSEQEIDLKIRELELEKDKVLNNLQETIKNLPPVTESVSNLLNLIGSELKMNAGAFAGLIDRKAPDTEINNHIMSIVRPYLTEGAANFTLNLDTAFESIKQEFDKKVNAFFNVNNVNPKLIDEFKKNGAEYLSKGISQLGKIFNPAMLSRIGSTLSRFRVPIVVAIGVAVTAVAIFFKNKKENEAINNREAIKKQFSENTVPEILGKLRDEVTTSFETEKNEKETETKKYIQDKVTEIEQSIALLQIEKNNTNSPLVIEKITNSVTQIVSMKNTL